jgi:hypothetical protein
LFHGDMFVSKWMRAFQSAIGDSLNEGLFLYFYTFYNPKSRKNLVEKKRILNESIAMLMSVKHSDAWKTGSLWAKFKLFFSTLWKWIRFGVQNSNLSDCQPALVHDALQYPEAKLFQRLSKIIHLHNHTNVQSVSQSLSDVEHLDDCADERKNSLLQRVLGRAAAFVKSRHSSTISVADSQLRRSEFDPPAEFMEIFSVKYAFLCNLLSHEGLATLATLLVFDQPKDFGHSSEAQAYLSQVKNEFEAVKKSMRAIYSVSREIIEEEEQVQRTQRWIVRQLKHYLLGEEGACLFRFNMFSAQDLGELFVEHDFEDFAKDDMLVIPVPQLVAAQLQIKRQQKSVQKFLMKYRNRNTDSDSSRETVASSKTQAALHQSILIKANRAPRFPSGFASMPQRSRPQMYASKQARTAGEEPVVRFPAEYRTLSQLPRTGINYILMKRMQTKSQLLKNESASGRDVSIRKDAALFASDEFVDGDDRNSVPENTHAFAGCVWVSQAQVLANELSELKAKHRQHDIDEDARVASLINEIEENVSLLAVSTTKEVQTRRNIGMLIEELNNLRGITRTLETSKESELEKLRTQFEYQMLQKNAELQSKSSLIRSLDDSFQSLPVFLHFEAPTQLMRAGGFSLRHLRDVLVHAARQGSQRLESTDYMNVQVGNSRQDDLQETLSVHPGYATETADVSLTFIQRGDPIQAQEEYGFLRQADESAGNRGIHTGLPEASTAVHVAEGQKPDSQQIPVEEGRASNNGKQAGTGVERI